MAKLFGGSAKAAPAPTVTPPAPMPDPESPDVAAAKRRKLLQDAQTSGRSSTILTAPGSVGSPLGGASQVGGASDYSAGTLGGR